MAQQAAPPQQLQPVYTHQSQQQQQTDYPPSPPPQQAGYTPPPAQPQYQQVPIPQHQQPDYYSAPQNRYTNDWQNPIFDCFNPGELCVNTIICPCIVFGKTLARIKDPSLSSYDTVNSDCFICAVSGLCGLSFIYQTFKRREIRDHFGLKGETVEDCLLSSFCAGCAIIQQEKEVVARQRAMGYGLPQHNMGYQRQPEMTTSGNM